MILLNPIYNSHKIRFHVSYYAEKLMAVHDTKLQAQAH